MTREELKREAKEYADKYGKSNFDLWDTARFAYYQGAEPREKCIEELEAEVKEWKDKADLWCKTANLKDHNIMINKELEAENAELKHTIAELRRDKDNLNTHTKAQKKLSEYRSDQLTKAKELLKKVLDLKKVVTKAEEYLLLEEAEQFISEVENV